MSKKDVRLVYTTDPVEAKRLRESSAMPLTSDVPVEKQTIKVGIDRKRRKGKTVTVASGFSLTTASLDGIAKRLKQRCAAGGKTGANEVEIQGDRVQTISDTLTSLGFKVKRS